jgi:queuine tRNA-ribosyltransferase
MLGARLLTQHNLHFYAALMREARRAIGEQRYAQFARDTETQLRERDEVGGG